MNIYDKLPTSVLEFLRDFVTVIHNAGKPTYESRKDLRQIKMELHLRSAPLMQDLVQSDEERREAADEWRNDEARQERI